MNKRLMKRHKRQVTRAREKGKQTEPDLRTPEQVAAAREISRAVAGPESARRLAYAPTPSPIRPSQETAS
jgi:hypothetical protein